MIFGFIRNALNYKIFIKIICVLNKIRKKGLHFVKDGSIMVGMLYLENVNRFSFI